MLAQPQQQLAQGDIGHEQEAVGRAAGSVVEEVSNCKIAPSKPLATGGLVLYWDIISAAVPETIGSEP